MTSDRSRRGGAAIIEVMIGLVVLAVAGVGLITLLGQTSHTMQTVARAERETQEAAATLAKLALKSRVEFDAMVGERRSGAFDIATTTLGSGFYAVAVRDTATGGVLLRTTFRAADTTGGEGR